jgi:hypothetical protein
MMWRKEAPDWQEAERAVRNCRSTLVILADGAPVVECFIDCLDALGSLISRSLLSGPDTPLHSSETLKELQASVGQVIDTGIAPHVADMLLEMCRDMKPP